MSVGPCCANAATLLARVGASNTRALISMFLAMGEFDARYPVALPARQPCAFALAIEIGRASAKQGGVHTLEGVDVHHGVHLALDLARDDGYSAAARADMEIGRGGAEAIRRAQCRLAHVNGERAGGAGCPHA